MRSPCISRFLIGLILALTISICGAIPVRVTRVIDGDTFETESGEKVRMIGINAPEASDVNGPEATHYLQDLIEGKEVTLVADEKSRDRDRYQRLLRYVEIGDADINLRMVQDGFAFAYLKYRFVRFEKYRMAQVTATEKRVGMWGGETPVPLISEESDGFEQLSSKAWFLIGLVGLLIALLLWSLLRR
jgi:micrococcal nuclease